MPALSMRFKVYTGTVDIGIPVTLTSELVRLGHAREADSVAICVKVKYQACNNAICLQPREMRIELEAPIGDMIVPDGRYTFSESQERRSFAPPAPSGLDSSFLGETCYNRLSLRFVRR